MKKRYIWSLPTRVFHWLLVIYILIIYIVSDSERLLNIHVAFGYGVGILVLFRIVWGFLGVRYSSFRDFPLSIKEIIEFGLNIFNPKKEYAGHNPLASFVLVGIIITLFLLVLSGILTYGIQEGRGVLRFLNLHYFKEMKLFKEIHESLGTIFLVLVFAHISGVILDRILHRDKEVLNSIFFGYKNIQYAKDVSLNLFQKLFATLFLVLSVVIVFVTINYQDSSLHSTIYNKIEYKEKFPLFVEECGSCHTLYAPFLLPKKSWRNIMANLEEHFGDDASLDKVTKEEIERFLIKNSAENSTKESAFYISKSIGSSDIIAITQSSYWKKKHKNINKEIFSLDRVKSKANCKACHIGIEQGLIEDSDIRDIEDFK